MPDDPWACVACAGISSIRALIAMTKVNIEVWLRFIISYFFTVDDDGVYAVVRSLHAGDGMKKGWLAVYRLKVWCVGLLHRYGVAQQSVVCVAGLKEEAVFHC